MKQYHFISRTSIYILSCVLIAFGIFHIMNPYDLFVYVPEFLPGGILWVHITGVALILVGLSFLSNRYVKFTGYLLGSLILVVILGIHLPNTLNAGVPEMRRLALVNLLKDAAIFCFALHIAASASQQQLHFEGND